MTTTRTPCPTCGASAGELCRTLRDGRPTPDLHAARYRQAQSLHLLSGVTTIAPLRPWLRDCEAEHIRKALFATRGNVSAAARLLDVSHRTLCRRIVALDIDVDGYRPMTSVSQSNPLK